MGSIRVIGTRVLVAAMMAACVGAGPPPGETGHEAALAKLGLKRAGDILVLEAEAEVRTKVGEARRLAGRLDHALLQQRSTMGAQEYQAALKDLNGQINQLRSELNATNQQMRQLPRSQYGRFRSGFANNLVAEQYAGLMAYRDQLQAEINQRTGVLGQLKGHPLDPKARQAIDAEVRDRREALHQAVLDLRRLVDATVEKYGELAKDPAVKDAVEAAGRAAGPKLRLGPSREFLANIERLERLEKGDSPDDAHATARPARKARGSSKGKRSSRAGANPGGSSRPTESGGRTGAPGTRPPGSE
jgi:hypothetical protein